jgi:outer membrane protein assembly factor BamB
MLGQPVKCPNSRCGQTFVAAEMAQLEEMEILEPEVVQQAKPGKPAKQKAKVLPKSPPPPVAANLPKAVAKAGPKEINWQDEQSAAPPPGTKEPAKPKKKVFKEDTSEIPVRSRKAKSGAGKMVLTGLGLLLVLVVGGVVGIFIFQGMKNEEKEALAAVEVYKAGNYPEAQRKYDELAKVYPKSKDFGKYSYFGQMSAMRASVNVVTVKENPDPAIAALNEFLTKHGDDDLSKPESGYGADIVQAGNKLLESIAEFGNSCIKRYKEDRTKNAEVQKAQQAVATGRELITKLERFREKNDPGFDAARSKFDGVDTAIRMENERLAVLAPWQELAQDPTDLLIAEFEKEMKKANLQADPDVLKLAAKAKAELRNRVKFIVEVSAAQAATNDNGTVLAVAPTIRGTPRLAANETGTGEVVTTVARGVLYVMDANSGDRLWTERIATDPSAKQAPVPLRITFGDTANDWLLVPTLLDGVAAVTARRTRTGEAVWQQPLPAPILGKPVMLGTKVFIALSDAKGTLIQLDSASGDKLYQGEIRQPIGGGLAALRGNRSGSGFLFVPGDARRVFVFEIGREDANGRRQPPLPVRVYATDHPTDSLSGEPLVIAPEQPNVPRRLILTQRDGPLGLKLRSMVIPTLEALSVPDENETKPEGLSEAAVAGWSWFPPVTDGERIAVATDSGLFALVGLNQPGNADAPLFELPGKKAEGDSTTVTRGLVVSAEEDSYWIVQNGKLTRMRTAVDNVQGFRIVASLNPLTVGEPLARGQVVPSLRRGYITVRQADQSSIQMIAFDLETGDVVWRRQLGAVAAAPPVKVGEKEWLFADECAGVHKVTKDEKQELLKVETISDPLEGVTSPTAVASSADGKHVWVVAGLPNNEGSKLLVRRYGDGVLKNELVLTVPALLGGTISTIGDQLLLPLANGFILRLPPDANTAVQGPAWRGPNNKPNTKCWLKSINDEEFLATDGDGNTVRRWKWAAKAAKAEEVGSWESTEPLSAAPLWLDVGGKPMLLTADNAGVAVFDPTRVAGESLRRWKGNAMGTTPPGKVTVLAGFDGVAVYCVEGKSIVALDPTKEQPLWVLPEPQNAEIGEVLGISKADNGAINITFTSGLIRQVNLKTGESRGTIERVVGSPALSTSAVTAFGNRLVLPSSDGSIGIVTPSR